MYCRLYIIICLLIFSKISFTQTTVNPEWITIEDGLSQGFISCMLQDKEGFIWMGTKNGLNRYDGERFEIFISDLDNPYSISGNYIYALHDDDHFILIGSEGGLNLYHKVTKRFHKIYIKGFVSSDPEITDIIKDNNGTYWIAEAKTESLFRITIPEFHNEVLEINDIIENIHVEKCKNVKNLYPHFLSKYKGGILYLKQIRDPIKWKKTFHLLDVNTNTISNLNSEAFQITKTLNNQNRFKYFVFNNTIAIYFWGENEIKIFSNERWETLKTNFKINSISYLQKSKQVLIEDESSYMIFDEKVLEKEYIHKDEALIIIPDKKINHTLWIQDYSGNNWIATAGYGIVKIGYRQSNIKTHFKGKSIYAEPYVDHTGNVYIGNPVTSERLLILASKEEFTKLNNLVGDLTKEPFLSYLDQDKEGTIWALHWDNDFYSLSKEVNGKAHKLKTVGKSSLLYTPIMTYDEDTHSLLIIFDAELVVYNINKNSFKTYSFQHFFNGFINRYDVIRTKNGHYWVGTNNGLVQIIPNGDLADIRLFNTKNGLRNNHAASLHSDPNNTNVLWIGTKGGGLHRLNINTIHFEYINSKNGLPNDVIYGILEDDNNNLWMSSNRGLISYNKKTKAIRNFNKADGLQSNEFNTYAYAKGADGKMYFGGINGLNVFHPSNFNKNENTPKVWITGIEINNEEITYNDESKLLPKAIEHTKNLVLPYSKNNMSLHFSALEYTASSNNRFSYYLEGAEEAWAHSTTDNKANYLNIAPGNYTFKLKATNGDGIGNNSIRSLSIKIIPPWYRTNLAYLLYIISLVTGVFFIVKIREEKIKNRQEIEKSMLENQLLKTEVAFKKKDLVDFAGQISENQKWGHFLLEKINKIRLSKGRTKGKFFDELEEDIKNKTFIEKNKIDFQKRIDILNNEFYQNLIKQYPKLSKTDLRLCTLIRLDFSTSEIAMMQNITKESTYISRKRLRKKLNLPSSVDLNVFLKQL